MLYKLSMKIVGSTHRSFPTPFVVWEGMSDVFLSISIYCFNSSEMVYIFWTGY
jgi:hypothetical protein